MEKEIESEISKAQREIINLKKSQLIQLTLFLKKSPLI